MTTILEDGQDGQVLLSDEMLAAIGAKIGDEVDVSFRDCGIVITPLKT